MNHRSYERRLGCNDCFARPRERTKDAITRFAPAGLLGALGGRNVDELTLRR